MVVLFLLCVASGCASFSGRAEDRHREAKAGLARIFISAVTYIADNGTYEIPDIGALGVDLPADRRLHYTYWYAVKGVPTAFLSPHSVPPSAGCDLTTPPTSVTVMASKDRFVAAAKGNLDDDATCDEWSVNDLKEFVHTLDDRTK
jgi:hypothetical protein